MTVFRNNKSFDKPVKRFLIRQAKPNVLPYRWQPNAPVYKLTQPHEKGTFFNATSGTYSNNGVTGE